MIKDPWGIIGMTVANRIDINTKGAFLLVALLGVAGCAQTPAPLDEAPVEALDVLEQRVPSVSAGYLGMPYQWGGNPDKTRGADCSHLISAVTRNSLKGTGYRFAPYYLNTVMIKENSLPIPRDEVTVGDIVFFDQLKKKGGSYHAGIVTGRRGEEIFFTHASSSKGVIETSTDSDSWIHYWRQRLDSFRRWKDVVFSGGGE